MTHQKSSFANDLMEALEEVRKHRNGDITLPSRIIDPISAGKVKGIRKALAKNPKDFERRFGIPARTLEGWEQGRKINALGHILLTVIEHAPETVEAALRDAQP